MRPVERIELFLEKVDLDKLLGEIWRILKNEDIHPYSKIIYTDLPKIKKYWLENPDLRFSQVLIALEIIPNIPGAWYYMEEPEILIELGCKSEDVYYWGGYYQKDGTPLDKPIWKPISELESDHLKAIINGGFVRRNKMYRHLMCKVLRSRGERL